MQPQFKKKQKVRILSVRGTEGSPKYPQNEPYVNETGVVVDSFYAGRYGAIDYTKHTPGDSYIYKVRLDKDNSVVTLVEEELEPCV